MISKNPLKKTPFLVAEISANHNGSLHHAKELINTAKKYGADGIFLSSSYKKIGNIILRKKINFNIKQKKLSTFKKTYNYLFF